MDIYAGTGADARLDEIRFDGVAREDLLAEEGAESANTGAAIMTMPAPDAAVQLRSVLDKLFARHTAA